MITMQALSEEERRLWMEAMDGREPVSSTGDENQQGLWGALSSPGQAVPCQPEQSCIRGAAPASCQENPLIPRLNI